MRCQNALGKWKLSRKIIPGSLMLLAVTILGTVSGGPAIQAETIDSGLPTRMWTDNHCGSCHVVNALFSHPIGVVPSMPVPAQLPLEGGRITCITCHEGDSDSHSIARTGMGSMLRGVDDAILLCVQCHDRTDPSRTAQHALALGRAHLTMGSHSASRVPSGRFDVETNICLSCHDGLMAQDAGSTAFRLNDLPNDHPIGTSMLATGLRDAPEGDELRSPQSLDRRIRLFDNRVGCGSCHSPFSTEKSLLVMSNRGSQLCLSCHAP